MAGQSFPYGKIFLSVGLLAVMIGGLALQRLVPEDPVATELQTAERASLISQRRLLVLDDWLHRLELLQKPPARAALDFWVILGRLSPQFTWRKVLFLTEKERVNVARKLENLEISLNSMERQSAAGPGAPGKPPASDSRALIAPQLEKLRKELAAEKAELRDRSMQLERIKNLKAAPNDGQ